jgi:hypothetical protein
MYKVAILAAAFAVANCHHNAQAPAEKSAVSDSAKPHHSVPDAGNTITLAAIALSGIGITGFALRRRRQR